MSARESLIDVAWRVALDAGSSESARGSGRAVVTLALTLADESGATRRERVECAPAELFALGAEFDRIAAACDVARATADARPREGDASRA